MSALHAKDAAAKRLIEWHFEVEPSLQEVYRIRMGDEGSFDEPIRLLEVNAATIPTGTVEPFRLAGLRLGSSGSMPGFSRPSRR